MFSCWNLVCNIRGTKSTAPKGEGKRNKKLINKKFLWTAEGVRRHSKTIFSSIHKEHKEWGCSSQQHLRSSFQGFENPIHRPYINKPNIQQLVNLAPQNELQQWKSKGPFGILLGFSFVLFLKRMSTTTKYLVAFFIFENYKSLSNWMPNNPLMILVSESRLLTSKKIAGEVRKRS